METRLDFETARALLAWQVEMGATEAIGDAPINRFDLPDEGPSIAALLGLKKKTPAAAARGAGRGAGQGPGGAKPARVGPIPMVEVDTVAIAEQAARSAETLEGLRDALAAYEHCDLKRGARNLVFADGDPAARVMIVGEAPGREEDIQGKPFVGPAGQLLDAMFAAIGLSRGAEAADQALYITNMIPWRPPQNRDPSASELAMMRPFVLRHIALVQPHVLVLMGNTACQGLLGRGGITRMRGTWAEVAGASGLPALPCMPMFHPAYLLRAPLYKREAWADLRALRDNLEAMG